MAQLVKIKDLAARKEALLAESEVYRQTLKMEVQNLKSCGERFRQKFGFLRLSKRLLFLVPLLSSVWAWRSSSRRTAHSQPHRRRNKLDVVLSGWRMYRTLAPMLGGILARRFVVRRRAGAAEEGSPAANI